MLFADVIVDISHENVDRTYQYLVPDRFKEIIKVGSYIEVKFGNRSSSLGGYVLSLSNEPKCDIKKIKEIYNIPEKGIPIEENLIKLAFFIKEKFGSTLNDSLKTVIPVKRTVKNREEKVIALSFSKEETLHAIEDLKKTRNYAKAKALEVLLEKGQMLYSNLVDNEKVSKAVIKNLSDMKLITITANRIYRNPISKDLKEKDPISTNNDQQRVVDIFCSEYNEGVRDTYLLHGITGSGKTEVYMEMIEHVIDKGKQVIMLIPEISLTYQTVTRFYSRFGSRVSILNSRLSDGERYDQYTRVKIGEVSIMIGPRSALFTPFDNLGLIIIDEEHEGSYKSEMPPKYHAREVAIQLAHITNASVVLGSATPSIESYKKALEGEYKLFNIDKRAGLGSLPNVTVVDLREELKRKNKSIFSGLLREHILEKLKRKEQIMLFINRRGYAGFVSCRSCGYVLKCPHCDISLTSHNNGKLVCHYCSYEQQVPKLCPECTSPYIAAFGTGTQKVEELVKKEFPFAKVLRMDMDTTSGKHGHEKILKDFSERKADILVGTQMIVKGHDFPSVTLVGIIAADLSLHANDYRASERTYQLLSQALGRAGRGKLLGDVVIQTYQPEHYCITTAANHNYKDFYEEEMAYRKAAGYPPCVQILLILVTAKVEDKAKKAIDLLGSAAKDHIEQGKNNTSMIGPTKATLSKANDLYRMVIYLKDENYQVLTDMKDFLEGYVQYEKEFKDCLVQFDFNPMSSY